MRSSKLYILVLLITIGSLPSKAYHRSKVSSFECGPYGFSCEGINKLRLCEGDTLFGPSFLCPPNFTCNEDSSDVCENSINHLEPVLSKNIKCRRNERIADPSVAGCKGYILCIPNKNHKQIIKFKCSGNTVFNGYTRTCSSPEKYKCPIQSTTIEPQLFVESNRRLSSTFQNNHDLGYTNSVAHVTRPIDCKNYKFKVTSDKGPVKAAYFCPPRPVLGENAVRCTIFSNEFCVTLEKSNEDQFMLKSYEALRKPRM